MNKALTIRIRQEKGYFCIQVKATGEEFRNTNIIHRANFKRVIFEEFTNDHLWKGEKKLIKSKKRKK